MADSGREDEGNHGRRHGRKRGFGHGEATPPPESRREHHRSPIDRRDERSFGRSEDSEGRGRHGRDRTKDVKRQGFSDSDDEPRRDSYGTDRSGRRRDSQQDSPIRRSSLHGGRGREEERYARKRQDGEHFPRRHEGRRRDSQQESPTRRNSFHDRRGREEERYDRKRQDELDAFGDGSHDGGNGRRSMNADGSYGRRRDMDEDAGRDRFAGRYRNAEQNNEELPDLYSVHWAKVQSVRPFGIFVRLEGFSKQGLVHLSQLSDHEVTDREDPDEMKVKAIAAIAGEGDQVWVKVISLKDEGGNVKIGCSLKLVSQSTGQDLDPSNVKLDQQQPKGNRQEPKKVALDAIYNVVCSRCGGHGHLKTECYATADKTYELLPEEDYELTEQTAQPLQDYELTEQTAQPLQDKMLSREAANTPGIGRGRAMVLPAWMTHGTGASVPQQLGREPKKKKKESELPDSVTTVEEALALIAQVKKEKKDKRHRKEHSKHKKEERSKKTSKKGSASRKDKG